MIAHLGVAGGPIDLMQQYIRTGAFDVVLTHNRFNLVDQSAEPLLEEAEELGVAVLNAAPFGGGILAGSKPAQGFFAYRRRPARILARGRAPATPPASATASRSRPPPCSSRCASRASPRRSPAASRRRRSTA